MGNGTRRLKRRKQLPIYSFTEFNATSGVSSLHVCVWIFRYIYIYSMGDFVTGLKQMQSVDLQRFTFISHILASCSFLWWLQYIRELDIQLEQTWFVSYTLHMITLQYSTIIYHRCNLVLTHTEEKETPRDVTLDLRLYQKFYMDDSRSSLTTYIQ